MTHYHYTLKERLSFLIVPAILIAVIVGGCFLAYYGHKQDQEREWAQWHAWEKTTGNPKGLSYSEWWYWREEERYQSGGGCQMQGQNQWRQQEEAQ